MKRIFCMVAALLLLTGCGAQKAGSTVDLMPGADAETSALALYVYDGEKITRQHLFETDEYRENVMEDFHTASVEEILAEAKAKQPPYYGIEMGGGDLGTIEGLWADGQFLTQDGKTYSFDYDFEALLKEHPWSDADEFQDLSVMPCAALEAKTADGWNTAFMTQADALMPPEGITMEAVVEGDLVKAVFTNASGEEWEYGVGFGLQVFLDGKWYTVPAEQELAFISIACILPDGESKEETYSLAAYGTLPGGTYRFVTQQLSAEFTVE